jgi:hypothetical protein
MRRRNSDEGIRRLEREAAQGSVMAQQRLVTALARSGMRDQAEKGNRQAAATLANYYEQAGVIPPKSAKTLMSLYGVVRDSSARSPGVGSWTGGKVRRFSIAHALFMANHYGRASGWTTDFSVETSPNSDRMATIAVALDELGQGMEYADDLPLAMTRAQKDFVQAELFYFSGAIPEDVEDPLAWSRKLGLDT